MLRYLPVTLCSQSEENNSGRGGVIPAFRANHIYVPSRRVSGLPSTPSEFPFQGFFNGSLMGQEWPGIGVWTPTLRERLGCGLVAHLRHQSPWY